MCVCACVSVTLHAVCSGPNVQAKWPLYNKLSSIDPALAELITYNVRRQQFPFCLHTLTCRATSTYACTAHLCLVSKILKGKCPPRNGFWLLFISGWTEPYTLSSLWRTFHSPHASYVWCLSSFFFVTEFTLSLSLSLSLGRQVHQCEWECECHYTHTNKATSLLCRIETYTGLPCVSCRCTVYSRSRRMAGQLSSQGRACPSALLFRAPPPPLTRQQTSIVRWASMALD